MYSLISVLDKCICQLKPFAGHQLVQQYRADIQTNVKMDEKSHVTIPAYILYNVPYNYSKICLKRPLKNRQNKGLKDMWYFSAGRKYSRMLHGSILQYFWPALSNYLSCKIHLGTSFEWPLQTGFTVGKIEIHPFSPQILSKIQSLHQSRAITLLLFEEIYPSAIINLLDLID